VFLRTEVTLRETAVRADELGEGAEVLGVFSLRICSRKNRSTKEGTPEKGENEPLFASASASNCLALANAASARKAGEASR
jgi:hypothetical protein